MDMGRWRNIAPMIIRLRNKHFKKLLKISINLEMFVLPYETFLLFFFYYLVIWHQQTRTKLLVWFLPVSPALLCLPRTESISTSVALSSQVKCTLHCSLKNVWNIWKSVQKCSILLARQGHHFLFMVPKSH